MGGAQEPLHRVRTVHPASTRTHPPKLCANHVPAHTTLPLCEHHRRMIVSAMWALLPRVTSRHARSVLLAHTRAAWATHRASSAESFQVHRQVRQTFESVYATKDTDTPTMRMRIRSVPHVLLGRIRQTQDIICATHAQITTPLSTTPAHLRVNVWPRAVTAPLLAASRHVPLARIKTQSDNPRASSVEPATQVQAPLRNKVTAHAMQHLGIRRTTMPISTTLGVCA